ncbi:MAG: metallophosphoesterase [Verrucomicrobiales bacterium]|nr:metallophosphoesterase [Verrucomicrobiales bacterium]
MRASASLLLCIIVMTSPLPAVAHDGPDPLLHWSFKNRFFKRGLLQAQKGPDVKLGKFSLSRGESKEGFLFADGVTARVGQIAKMMKQLPAREFTISTWASVHQGRRWGGIFSCLEDNSEFEKGLILGYSESQFYIALATAGTDDGDGMMTYLKSRTSFVPARLYHLAATYDGRELKLYLNGKLEAVTQEQSGDILYPKTGTVGLAGYIDSNEDHPHEGEILNLRVYDHCALAQAIADEFEGGKHLLAERGPELNLPLAFVVKPYLQFGEQTGMTVMWESTHPDRPAVLRYGVDEKVAQRIEKASVSGAVSEARINGLQPDTQYFYRVELTPMPDGEPVLSNLRTFRTAPPNRTPFSFAVISDTQGNPKVSGTLAGFAWEQRPSFLLHPGDLVSEGPVKNEWVSEFFATMNPVVSRVPFFPVLGNHERDAQFYYDYMSLPEPEYYYTFRWSNAQFFMLDTNKELGPGSVQHAWLERVLRESTADWKFVCHHHPPYSSDENDFGNLWKSNQSTHGDRRPRQLTDLYDKHGVNIVFNGHIHSYERTWPIRAGKPVDRQGTIYLITGGGGGGLERPAPSRPGFSNYVRRGHHYCMIHINGRLLEYRAYDLEDRMFDTFSLRLGD